MKHLLSYLWKSPLIRLTTFWLVLAIIGISLFSWKISNMRTQIAHAVQKSQTFISQINKIDSSRSQPEQQISRIIEEIEKFRPTVPELLNFVEKVEELAEKRKTNITLQTIQKPPKAGAEENQIISYKLEIETEILTIQSFLRDFETLPFAITIETLDISKTENKNIKLTITFGLHTKFS